MCSHTISCRRWFQKVRSVFFRSFPATDKLKRRKQYPKFRFLTCVVYYETNYGYTMKVGKRYQVDQCKIGSAINLHLVALTLSFVNIIVAQIWLIATIFRLLMWNIMRRPDNYDYFFLVFLTFAGLWPRVLRQIGIVVMQEYIIKSMYSLDKNCAIVMVVVGGEEGVQVCRQVSQLCRSTSQREYVLAR